MDSAVKVEEAVRSIVNEDVVVFSDEDESLPLTQAKVIPMIVLSLLLLPARPAAGAREQRNCFRRRAGFTRAAEATNP